MGSLEEAFNRGTGSLGPPCEAATVQCSMKNAEFCPRVERSICRTVGANYPLVENEPMVAVRPLLLEKSNTKCRQFAKFQNVKFVFSQIIATPEVSLSSRNGFLSCVIYRPRLN